MKILQPAQEFLLIQVDPPAKSPGGLTLPTQGRPTTGTVLKVGHKAAEEGFEPHQRVLWVKDPILVVVEKGDDDKGDTIILHVENLRAIL